ncbi:hypothetical protein CIG75_09850 [Tumebacillus algifaecis]|uniref:Uncharacterized protein n=1 Tax=Tumebacillus algifaecis TaxID=1214604 RepID=A0A223D1K3_9BACL|nr:thiamine pyrophosphate-binding protein [Tumebacillus algifaecis]ASS75257.1 hypothetical protein CIG75_09850 [Tumebacillus algifaecis]
MNQVAERIISTLLDNGYRAFTGVPCSLLKGAFRLLEEEMRQEKPRLRYVSAVREDSALGLAAGMYLGGEKTVVLMQNSGLGYCLNVLTSMSLIYDIPNLMVISWRGAEGMNDAVEHDIIGERLLHVLDAVGITYVLLDPETPEASVEACLHQIEELHKPVALLIRQAV